MTAIAIDRKTTTGDETENRQRAFVYPADYSALPEPVDVPWRLKPVSSADSGIEVTLGSSIVAACMTGALVFGGVNHFLSAGIDHISTTPAGVWRVPFQATAVLLALTEAAGAAASLAGVRRFVPERRKP